MRQGLSHPAERGQVPPRWPRIDQDFVEPRKASHPGSKSLTGQHRDMRFVVKRSDGGKSLERQDDVAQRAELDDQDALLVGRFRGIRRSDVSTAVTKFRAVLSRSKVMRLLP